MATVGARLYGYDKYLTKGERGVVQLLAVDRQQCQVAFRYVKSFFEVPALAEMVVRVTADTLELNNQISIEITTSDQRRVRGRTVVFAILDEVAHWQSATLANPDTDIYQAIRPAMATIPNAMMIGISSPYSRKGLLWSKYDKHYGQDDPSVLVTKAPTWVMNPTLARDGDVISEAYENDPAWASAEYGSEFRDDIEAIFSLDAVRACVDGGVREKAPERKHKYFAFVDPSGGSGQDSMTMAISHKEGETAILDLLLEIKPPFSPEVATEQFVETAKRYRVTKVFGDRFGGEWPREQFRKFGLNYELAEQSRTQLYQGLLPLVNSRAVDLLDNDRLVLQLVSLERRQSRGGRPIVDHPSGGHDDLANAAAGALVLAGSKSSTRSGYWEDQGMAGPRVKLGYAHSKAHMMRDLTSDGRVRVAPRNSVPISELTTAIKRIPVGTQGHYLVECDEDRFALHLPNEQLVTYVTGRDLADEKMRELIETGKLTRKKAS